MFKLFVEFLFYFYFMCFMKIIYVFRVIGLCLCFLDVVYDKRNILSNWFFFYGWFVMYNV